ncbi:MULTISPECIES: RNA methyltransferase [unclassified Methanoculleus]|jgi:TrmH family RNA methyltransferase|uniref:RNA methyltransferase n=1 Tax=unclassified Methanoculleus TaxID=2619537 RepID=UPI0025EF0B70|nr:RNA methyltransferase [Methanoculleus sp. UBA303]MCE5338560.1 RNA methyltransferase [Methanomicrobiaceae archaeon]MDD3932861.1 RNA methyltransferase [Methanoculleus sp.]
MPEVSIVLVEPLYEGNVGFTARVMKNFGFTRLVLVNPCPLGNDAVMRASHARDVLEGARRMTVNEVYREFDFVVATTGEVSKSVCTPMRMPYYAPAEVREAVADIDGTVAVLFGRENWGLANEELKRANLICTIPTSNVYPILNLSHAVGILCYELADLPRGAYPLAGPVEMDSLYRHFGAFLDRIDHPDFKRENTMIILRRVLGRTKLTIREVSTLHGLMRRTEWHLENNKE